MKENILADIAILKTPANDVVCQHSNINKVLLSVYKSFERYLKVEEYFEH